MAEVGGEGQSPQPEVRSNSQNVFIKPYNWGWLSASRQEAAQQDRPGIIRINRGGTMVGFGASRLGI